MKDAHSREWFKYPRRPKKTIRLLDLMALLYNVHRGAEHEEVGFEDTQETLDSMTRKLNVELKVDMGVLESALWSCNLLNEKKQFWHPRGLSFDSFVLKLLGRREKFHPTYNLIEKVEAK